MNEFNMFIFLADDDVDDCIMFENALREISAETRLTTARNGEELMTILDKTVPPPPSVIFLDLNMPRKNGFECLVEIKVDSKFKNIPVVIFSTSAEGKLMNECYEKGADYYIQKPNSNQKLKDAIFKVLSINWENHTTQPSRDKFALTF